MEVLFMGDITKIPLISSEIAGLWSSYMSDTMIVAVLKYYLRHVEDEETRAILQQISDLSNQNIKELTNLLNAEQLPIPDGFTDKDVNINAPRLFTDAFYLHYLGFMSRIAMNNYTLILNQIARSDIRAFFSKRINEYINLYNNSADLRLSKGIFIKAPRVEVPKNVQYIKSQSFLTDWFGEKRPLLAIELTHVFSVIYGNIVGGAITTAFGQVSKDKTNSKYYFDGKIISTKQFEELTSLLIKESIAIPSSSDSYVTDSTVAPFSEKLMLNHTIVLASSGISRLGMSIANTMRSDLQTMYIKFTAEDMKYSKYGADILIDNGWLEQPPQAIKHENLAGV
jgi:hypothetical protein